MVPSLLPLQLLHWKKQKKQRFFIIKILRILILKTRILSYLSLRTFSFVPRNKRGQKRTKAEFSNHHTISNGYDGNKRNCKIFRILIIKNCKIFRLEFFRFCFYNFYSFILHFYNCKSKV